ncbi:hypothetical protein LU640_30385 [Pseudomonas monteilii]|uniref:DUF6708 domain-containing protein n=2 Tax=Pseudomonas TaxID=286 RepID=UPI0005A88116|nr:MULTISPECIES: DUF6708 domain-containing protein [Pseudomonas]KPM58002.1 hypothetical protein HB4184_26985 [Pseudomonas putida]MBA1320022.1 hypothetical protein [Pseudomonas monteilii]MCE1021721.1 hypothetical protein [Pseudomonas monteilii]MCE1038986.1 hypothetical protein [Pseudomonas monteilii]MCE1090911.1 hypothetical protein [Pseudomonas monteilii]
MTTTWLFSPNKKTDIKPKIHGQISSLTDTVIQLRNPWVSDSVFMAKMYTGTILAIAMTSYAGSLIYTINYEQKGALAFIAIQIFGPLIFTPFLAYRIFFIKKLSSIYLNRTTQKIYYKRINKLMVFDWSNTGGGVFKRTEFGGSSFSTSYALAFAPRRADGSLHQKDCLWVDSNEPTESDVRHVAEVWEYLRHFMAHGPDKLPPPGEPNWWHKPLHAICLTPAEAWRHYAPWRTGEPGEMQGKKNWQLPFWAVLFPYNLIVAICWYFICKLFNVRAAPPPPEAFEELPARASKRRRA